MRVPRENPSFFSLYILNDYFELILFFNLGLMARTRSPTSKSTAKSSSKRNKMKKIFHLALELRFLLSNYFIFTNF